MALASSRFSVSIRFEIMLHDATAATRRLHHALHLLILLHEVHRLGEYVLLLQLPGSSTPIACLDGVITCVRVFLYFFGFRPSLQVLHPDALIQCNRRILLYNTSILCLGRRHH